MVIPLQDEKVSVKLMQLIGKVYMLFALIEFAKLGSQIYSKCVSIINLGLDMSFSHCWFDLAGLPAALVSCTANCKEETPSSYTIVDVIKNRGFKTTKFER